MTFQKTVIYTIIRNLITLYQNYCELIVCVDVKKSYQSSIQPLVSVWWHHWPKTRVVAL